MTAEQEIVFDHRSSPEAGDFEVHEKVAESTEPTDIEFAGELDGDTTKVGELSSAVNIIVDNIIEVGTTSTYIVSTSEKPKSDFETLKSVTPGRTFDHRDYVSKGGSGTRQVRSTTIYQLVRKCLEICSRLGLAG
jgi:hypothetical protein